MSDCICPYVLNDKDASGHSTACMEHPKHQAKAARTSRKVDEKKSRDRNQPQRSRAVST